MTALQKNLRCCCLKPKPKIPEKDIKIINRRVNKMSFNKRSIGSWWQLIQMDHSRAVGPWKVPSGLKSRLSVWGSEAAQNMQIWSLYNNPVLMHDHHHHLNAWSRHVHQDEMIYFIKCCPSVQKNQNQNKKSSLVHLCSYRGHARRPTDILPRFFKEKLMRLEQQRNMWSVVNTKTSFLF